MIFKEIYLEIDTLDRMLINKAIVPIMLSSAPCNSGFNKIEVCYGT